MVRGEEPAPRYRMVLAKEDFKFAAAHFTLLPGGEAELLHGHNYRVRVALTGSELDGDGLLVDLESFKRELRALCRRFDGRTLLPARSDRLRCTAAGDAVAVRLGERAYSFPAADTLLLPLANTSIELLARHFWEELAPGLAGSGIELLAVSVEETAGQRCIYEAALDPSRGVESQAPGLER